MKRPKYQLKKEIVRLDRKGWFNYMLPTRNPLKYKDINRIKVKRWK